MRIRLRYFDGSFEEAIVLAASSNRIRVAIPGRDDAAEFTWANGVWLSDENEPVEIGNSPAAEEIDWLRSLEAAFPGWRSPAWNGMTMLSVN